MKRIPIDTGTKRLIDFSTMFINDVFRVYLDNRIGFKSSCIGLLIVGNLTQRFSIGIVSEMKNGFRMAAIIFIGWIRLIYHIIISIYNVTISCIFGLPVYYYSNINLRY